MKINKISGFQLLKQGVLQRFLLSLLKGDKPLVLQRKKIGDRLLQKVTGFVETFIDGMDR